LLEKEVQFDLVTVQLNNKPEWYKRLYRSVHPDPRARAKVPILEVGKPNQPGYIKLVESEVVARFVARHWRSQGTALLPEDAVREARMNLFVQQFMDGMSASLFTFPAAKSGAAVSKHFETIVNALQAVQRAFQLHGEQTTSGPYFFGEQYSLAETLTAPFVVRMIPIFKHHRGVDVLCLCEALGASELKRWMQAVCERPSTVQSLPAENSLLALAPYMQPFFEYHIPQAEQQATITAAMNLHAAAQAEEAAFKETLAEGTKMAGYEAGTLRKATSRL